MHEGGGLRLRLTRPTGWVLLPIAIVFEAGAASAPTGLLTLSIGDCRKLRGYYLLLDVTFEHTYRHRKIRRTR